MARLDPVLARLRNSWGQLRTRQQRHKAKPPPCRIVGFGESDSHSKGRALLIYVPEALTGRGAPPAQFNPGGAVVEIAAALNESGLVVDAIGIDDADFPLDHSYELVVAHAGPAYSALGRQLPSSSLVLDYSTGCHWTAFNEQSERRYHEFAERRQLGKVPPILRPLVLEHEEYAAARADLVVCLGEETGRTFEPFARNVTTINNSAYTHGIEPRVHSSEASRCSFLYSGGSGNVQKGVDLLIEAFAAEPDLHLYLDTPLEPEILATYGSELRRENLHYCEWRTRIRGSLKATLERCSFAVHAGMNSGQSTSLVASLAWGLIPVITTESNLGRPAFEVHIEASKVDAIRHAIRTAAGLPSSEIATRSRAAIEMFNRSFSPGAFRSGFRKAVDSLLP